MSREVRDTSSGRPRSVVPAAVALSTVLTSGAMLWTAPPASATASGCAGLVGKADRRCSSATPSRARARGWSERSPSSSSSSGGASCNHQNKFSGTLADGSAYVIESAPAENCGCTWSHAGWKTIQRRMRNGSDWCARARSSITNNVYTVPQCHGISS